MGLINLNMLALPYASATATVPVGTVVAFMGQTVPEGWLLCDGSEISRGTYAELFTQLGTMYGEGDGASTFNLPDLTDGKFLEGATTAGAVMNPGLPNITGSSNRLAQRQTGLQMTGPYYRSTEGYQAENCAWNGGSNTDWQLENAAFDASRANAIYGASTTVQPYAMTVRFIIRAVSQLTADETGFTIIYPNNGSREHPANVISAQRYVMPNPFPGHYVHCVAEIMHDGKWGHPGGFVYNASNGYGHGVIAAQYDDGDIVIQVGELVTASSEDCGNSFGKSGSAWGDITQAPCRVKVWQLNKIIQT